MKFSNAIQLFSIAVLCAACNSEPKVIEPVSKVSINNSHTESTHINVSPVESQMHQVVVHETLDTDKYTYMKVTENGEEFWVAATKRQVEIGGTYYFNGGLLKRNFFSKEYNRTFETLYLVSGIHQKPISTGEIGSSSAIDVALTRIKGNVAEGGPMNVKHTDGAITLEELFRNMEKYSGKSVTVTGKVVKVNPMIMGRNWAHIQDGTGEGLDLTITTNDNVPLGHVVSMEGVIALNKDFGAGYKYDIILEEAELK